MIQSEKIVRVTEMEQDKTVLHGACPFLALRQLCLDEKVKFTAVAKALFDNTKSANRAFWVFCNKEVKKLSAGETGYTLSYERKERLAKIGVAVEVFMENGAYKTSVWICDHSAFSIAVSASKKRKNK